MAYNAVDATAENALQGLYLTPDMWFCAAHLTPRILESTVDKMHQHQPLTTDFDPFADTVNNSYHLWHGVKSPYLDNDDVRLGDLMMMAADVSQTYSQIRRGLYAATDMATTIMLRTQNAADEAAYARAIPAALENMRIPDIEHVNVETFHRILTVDPWLSWMERLRAQKQRTRIALKDLNASLDLQDGTAAFVTSMLRELKSVAKAGPKIERAARKSIRKSVKMFNRVLGPDSLQTFLRSQYTKPLQISGHVYDYSLVMRPKSLIRATIELDTRMSTVATTVYSKKGDRLCELCHYFRDTPVLDCVIATALNVHNEETELDLLRAACVIDAPRGFYHDPVLPELKQLYDPAMAPTLVENVLNHVHTLPIGRQSAVRDNMRENALPLAYCAFKKISPAGKQYFPLMRICGDFSLWDYLDGDEQARLYLRLIQRTITRGEFY